MFVIVNIAAVNIVAHFLNTAIADINMVGLPMFLGYILSFLMFLLCLVVYRFFRSRGEKLDSIFKHKFFSPSILLWGVLLTLSSQIVSDPIVALFPDSSKSMFSVLTNLGSYAIILTVFIAPLLEEFVFRGVVLNDIRHSYGSFTAIVVSALFFSLIHLNLAQILPAFLIGIVFGYVYIVSGSIWSVILLHMINNALAYILFLIVPNDDLSKSLFQIIQPQYIAYIIYLSALVMLFGMFVKLIFVCRSDNKQRAEQVNNLVANEEILSQESNDTTDENNDDHTTKLTDTPFL